MRRPKYVMFAVVLALCAPSASRGDMIQPKDVAFFAGTGINDAYLVYDATTNLFTLGAAFGASSGPYSPDPVRLRRLVPFEIVAADLFGSFTMWAEIGERGGLFGGRYSWVGESASLGIGQGTTILGGTLRKFAAFDDGGVQDFQFLARATVIDPAFRDVVGPVKSLLIWVNWINAYWLDDFPWWDQTWDHTWEHNWDHSWDTYTATSAPGVFLIPHRVAEPTSLSLFGLALAAFAFFLRRRRETY